MRLTGSLAAIALTLAGTVIGLTPADAATKPTTLTVCPRPIPGRTPVCFPPPPRPGQGHAYAYGHRTR